MANSSAIPIRPVTDPGKTPTRRPDPARARRPRRCTTATSGWRWHPVHAGMVHLGHRPRAIPDAVHPFDEPISTAVAGSDAMWPQISESSARPPGDGNPMPCK